MHKKGISELVKLLPGGKHDCTPCGHVTAVSAAILRHKAIIYISKIDQNSREVSNEGPDLRVGVHQVLDSDCCIDGQARIGHNTQDKWVC